MRKVTLALSAAALALVSGSLAAQPADRADHGAALTQQQFKERAAAMFARMDANGDGTINAADRAARQADRFARLDTDRNGEISRSEMEANAEQRRARMAERRERRAERRAERAPERAERMAERREARFAMIDVDNNGALSQAELAAARERRAEARAERRAASDARSGQGMKRGKRGGMMHGLLRQADANGDRAISRAEFDAAVAAHFTRLDTNRDGTVTAEERRASRQAMRAARRAS